MSYVYRDDTAPEDMNARDHYIKASLIAAEALEEAKLGGDIKKAHALIEIAKLHCFLSENDVNNDEAEPECPAPHLRGFLN